jgi:glutamate-1-semialdehyde 2,1-aminomutase
MLFMRSLSESTVENDLKTTARRVMPAGGLGNVASQIVIREGREGRVWDESGREYVDFLLGSGPMLVGHSHPSVTAAVQAQVVQGTTFFVNNRQAIQLAATIVDAIECAEQVRFVSSGTEADMYAMRLARAFRGRERILKFEGGYHGMSDHALMSLAPKELADFPEAVPDSAGIPSRVRDEVLVAPFNDLAAVEALIEEYDDELAAVIVEPLQRLIPPLPGFLEGLRRLTKQYGIVLIFDEVVTGFRFAYGGAQAYYGVTPDICTLGKVVGGGFPLAAVAGRADIMSHFDSSIVGTDKFLVQIGTLSGNPVAAAAGNATLELLHTPGAYEKIFATGRELMNALSALLLQYRVPAQVIGEPPMFDVVFSKEPIIDYRGVLAGNADMARRFNAKLLERGILKGDSKYYVSLAHSEDDVRYTIAAWTDALAELITESP